MTRKTVMFPQENHTLAFSMPMFANWLLATRNNNDLWKSNISKQLSALVRDSRTNGNASTEMTVEKPADNVHVHTRYIHMDTIRHTYAHTQHSDTHACIHQDTF